MSQALIWQAVFSTTLAVLAGSTSSAAAAPPRAFRSAFAAKLPSGLASSQAPATTAKAGCAEVLTDDEVAAAVGRRGATSENQENEPGNSQCRWSWGDTESTVTVSYTNTAGITARAATTRCCPDRTKSQAAQFFDYAIRIDMDLGSEPPASLTGIGERAALFFEDTYLKLVVQRPDGVASIVGANITREQMLALAKAIAAP